jgi:hypothetical protein
MVPDTDYIDASPAAETLLPPRTEDDFVGGSDPNGVRPEGMQPGFNIAGISPMSPSLGDVFGPQPG